MVIYIRKLTNDVLCCKILLKGVKDKKAKKKRIKFQSKLKGVKMHNLDDQKLGKLLTVISHYALENLEEVISYDDKSEAEKEDIAKAALKSLEVSAVLTLKFLNNESFNEGKLNNVFEALEKKEYDKANSIINEKIEEKKQ